MIINKAKCVGVKDILTCLFDWNTARLLPFMVPLLTYTILTEQYCLGLAIYGAFVLFCDILYYKFSIAIFDPELVIARGYNLSAFFNDTLHGAGLDYGFNFYDGDYTKTRHQAQIDKFEYAYQQLQLAEGMSLLDCGCGCGDWMYWLQTKKNIKVVGVNITPQQGTNFENALMWSKLSCTLLSSSCHAEIARFLFSLLSGRGAPTRTESDLLELEDVGLGKRRIGGPV